jgi:peptidoglycan/xylan/chitin deacetylase (PgdA/CDA1 family)
MKRVTITFDYEGSWGMPHARAYDQLAVTKDLLAVLDAAGAKAVFFVTGKLVEEHPECVRAIHEGGHEVGLHGYTHEHMHDLADHELKALAYQLEFSCRQVEAITGYKPRGFRSPYLMGPAFYEPRVYQMLAGLGFTWISNREIRMPEELFVPGRLPMAGAGLLRVGFIRRWLLGALNLKLLLVERPQGRGLAATWRWLTHNPQPFNRPEGLLEYPLTSPLDCDLLGFPSPSSSSPEAVTDYALKTITDCYQAAGDSFNINAHDWISGTTNRIGVLERTLKYINRRGDATYVLPGLEVKS